MAVIHGKASAADIAAAHVPKAPAVKKVLVRLKSRSILEPGCITVEPGHVMEIPLAHFQEEHHELVNPPSVAAQSPGPPAEAAAKAPAGVSAEDLDDLRLFEDP